LRLYIKPKDFVKFPVTVLIVKRHLNQVVCYFVILFPITALLNHLSSFCSLKKADYKQLNMTKIKNKQQGVKKKKRHSSLAYTIVTQYRASV